jgi:hypothetical protein
MPIDYKEYGPNWKYISERIRFVRAGNHCEMCGAVNYMPHPETGSKVVLTVAHLSHNIKDNREENLKALCQKCHLNHDRALHVFNRKYGRDTRRLNYNLFTEGNADGSGSGKIIKRIKKLLLPKVQQ